MRIVTIGGKEIGLKATPLALLFYKQEFKSDLVGDMVVLSKAEKDPTKIDSVILMQIIWTMNKAHEGFGIPFPNFPKWLESLDSIDFSNDKLMLDVLEEAEQGFFRSGGGAKPPDK